MRKKSSLPASFSRLLRTADLIVSYTPLPDEPDPRSIEGCAGPKSRIVALDQNPSSDPIDTARKLRDAHGDVDRAILLIPGRAFDLIGTRRGRGRGWYDRFLHELPRNWMRVGVAFCGHIHENELLRNMWDEPMDRLMINDADGWHMRRCTGHRVDQS